MVRSNSNISMGLFLLRFGLGLFLALWALNKIISPETSAALFARFYYIDLYPSVVMIIGALQLALSLLFMLGIYKNITYGLGLAIHIIATVGAFQEIMSPFGSDILYVSYIPILCSFITLFLLRQMDNRWTLSKKPKMFS